MRASVTLLFVIIATSQSLAQPPDLVYPVGTEFAKNGRAWRFIGVNIRGLVHYGGGDGALPYTSLSHIDENLAGARDMGCRVVRVFAANKNISHQDAVNRLGYALDKADQYGLKLIIALTDFYPTPFHPQGDNGYYTLNPSNWTVLNNVWFGGEYQNNYLPYVTLAVTTHKDHPAVFSWQLGNEIASQTQPAYFAPFVQTMAAHIKSIDPYHMVSIGMLSIEHNPLSAGQAITLFSDPNLDFLTIHSYNGQQWDNDLAVRSAVEKPIIVSEAGCDTSVNGGNRVGFMNDQINNYVYANGARGFMHWGYQAQPWDIGDGDNAYGIDRYAHSDYNDMFAMYQSHAATLNAYNEPLAEQTAPRGRNLALDAIAWQADTHYNASYGGNKAYDGLLNTKWTSTNVTSEHWLTIDLGQEQIVTGYIVKLAGAANEWPTFNWKHYLIQTGPSMTGPWTTAFDVNNSAQIDSITSNHLTPILTRYVHIYVDDCGIDDYARLPEFEVIGDPSPRADFDSNQDVDLADFAIMQQCFSGSGVAHNGSEACTATNLEQGATDPQDGDVDLIDYAEFINCMLGPNGNLPLECY